MTNEEHQQTEAQIFYHELLQLLQESRHHYMVGGGFAFFHYTGIVRFTKDLDIFCKPSEYSAILQFFNSRGYTTELTDARWLAKVFSGSRFMDIIFDSPNGICAVDDSWYQHAVTTLYQDIPVQIMPLEELIWCKLFVQNRERYDGSDINHLLLHQGDKLDWERLMTRVDRHWQLLLAQFLSFQFVYPSDFRSIIPRSLFDGLLDRARQQYEGPVSVEKICRGPLIDQTQYAVDILQGNYKAMTIKTI